MGDPIPARTVHDEHESDRPAAKLCPPTAVKARRSVAGGVLGRTKGANVNCKPTIGAGLTRNVPMERLSNHLLAVNLEAVSARQDIGAEGEHLGSRRSLERFDQLSEFSPRCDGLVRICRHLAVIPGTCRSRACRRFAT